MSFSKGECTEVLEDINVSARKVDTGIEYHVSIPWSDIPLIRPGYGRTCGFNVLVNERDHFMQSRSWIEWAPGMVVERNSSLFGRLQFSK